jgi:hypothetical protein
MPRVTLLNIRHGAAEKLTKETLRVQIPVEHLGGWYPAVIYPPAYPREQDDQLDDYTFKCVSVNASLKRLRRLYTALGGRANPPWTGVLIDGQEINGNQKGDSDD